MKDEKLCNVCGDNRFNVYIESIRHGTAVEYQSIGLCSLCGSVVEL